MGMIMYGTKVFTKALGYVGNYEQCQNCGSSYKKCIVRYKKWAHLNYIPLFPIKTTYYKMCPVCANGTEISRKEAKAELMASADQQTQNLEFYATHNLANKPKGIMSVDQSYEFRVKDVNNNQDICICSGVTKDVVKNMKKQRGIKTIQYVNVG